MHVVYHADNLFDAHLVRMALEQAGVPAFVLGEALLGGIGELPAGGLLTVCIPPSCAEAADALVQALPLVVGAPAAEASTPWPGALPA